MNRRHAMAYGLLALEIIVIAVIAYLIFFNHVL